MSVHKKGRSRFNHSGREFVWWVDNDTFVRVASADKSLVVAYLIYDVQNDVGGIVAVHGPEFPGIEIVGVPCAADWNREKGIRCAEDFLTAYPTGLDFIWAASNEMGLGAMLAAEAAGRLELAAEGPVVGDTRVAIFTNDVTPESVDRIAEGRIVAETTHGFADWGWFGTYFAVRQVCGLDVESTFDIRPRIAYQANARLFYPDPVLPELDWEEVRDNCQ